MKISFKELTPLFLLLIASLNLNAQCDGVAGVDINFCDVYTVGADSITLGSLDNEINDSNYSFEWYAIFDPFFIDCQSYYVDANQILNDVNILNPTINVFPKGNTTLILSVTDSLNSTCLDTVQLKVSGANGCLAECVHQITEGDSITLSSYCLWPIIEPVTVNEITVAPAESTSYNISMIDGFGCEYFESCLVMVFPSSIKEFGLSEIKILNNPFNNEIRFTIDELKNYNLDFKISNLEGKILQKGKLKKFNQINSSNFSNGIYFLNILNNQQILKTIKLIKSN